MKNQSNQAGENVTIIITWCRYDKLATQRCDKRFTDVDHLKNRIVEEWVKSDHFVVDKFIQQWRKRLVACVRANCGQFEHKI